MSSDMLSQEDIDSLIPAAQEAAASDNGGGLSGERLKPVLNVISEQMSTVLLTVLGKEISVSVDSVGAADEKKLTDQFAGNAVAIKVELAQKVNGPFFFVYSKNDVALLADLMMMGDGSAAYEEDHKDAIFELTNQIMGAVTSTFGTTFEAQVTASSSGIEDFAPAGMDLKSSLCAALSMKVEEIRNVKFAVIFPNSTAADLAAMSAKAKSAGGAAKGASSPAAGGESGFDFSDVAGADMGGMPLQNFSQPAGHLATDKSMQFTSTGNPQIDMLLDVTLQVSIELGRTEMSIKKILDLGPGSIIELNRMAGEPVDLLVNDKVIAKGEVVVVDENFGIRIVKLVSPEERLKNLK